MVSEDNMACEAPQENFIMLFKNAHPRLSLSWVTRRAGTASARCAVPLPSASSGQVYILSWWACRTMNIF